MNVWASADLDKHAVRIFQALIPDLSARSLGFRVNTSEVDDELLELFKDHIGKLVESLLVSVAGQLEVEMRRDAHSLQGMGGTMGVPALSVVAEELSAGAKRGDYPYCTALSEGLREWMAVWTGPWRAEP